jgi:predicted RNase H-like HicB family nuclease
VEYSIELLEEEDGRWLAVVPELPGVMTYGRTPAEARASVQALALHVIADRMEHGESPVELVSLSFKAAKAA